MLAKDQTTPIATAADETNSEAKKDDSATIALKKQLNEEPRRLVAVTE